MEEDDEDNILLTSTAAAIASFLSCSFSALPFPVKWQLMYDKFSDLHSCLAAMYTGKNSALVELLRSITCASREAQSIADRCRDGSFAGGKLLLRSELDLLITKLHRLGEDLAKVYDSSVLTYARAIVVSKPTSGASDEMQFYINDLISRIKFGSVDMRVEAMAALNEVLLEDEKYATIVAVDIVDGISVLANLVESTDTGIKEKALEAVSTLAGFDIPRSALAAAAVVSPLVNVLEFENTTLAKEQAARALVKLTGNSDNAWAVSAQGGVMALLGICNDMTNGTELTRLACCVLKNLSSVDEIRKYMVETGAIVILSKLAVSADDEVVQIPAMDLVAAIVSDDQSTKQRAVKEGAVESLFHVLDRFPQCSPKAREVALRSIEIICFSSMTSVNRLLNSGFLDRVLCFLRSSETSLQHSALKVASRLCSLNDEVKKSMGDAGFMPELVNILDVQSGEVREIAAEALSVMVSVQKNRKRLVQEGRDIGKILQLINAEEEKSSTKGFLLSALMHLSDSSSVRRKIASSEYVKNLERLAEANMMEAKKIVKKISGNRFRSILNNLF